MMAALKKYVVPEGACARCVKRGKNWSGTDPRCAFLGGTFDKTNWNCATMVELRRLADRPGCTHLQGDSRMACMSYEIPEDAEEMQELLDVRGFLVLAWYKNRGATDRAFTMDEDAGPRELKLAVAEKIIAALNGGQG